MLKHSPQKKNARKENSLNFNQQEVLREKNRRLAKKNTELQNKIAELESSIDELEYENIRITKLQEEFFDNTY